MLLSQLDFQKKSGIFQQSFAKALKSYQSIYGFIRSFFSLVPSKPPQSVAAERLKAAEFIKVTWSPVPFGYVGGLLMGYSIKYRRIVTAEKEVLPLEEETATAKSTDLFIFVKVQTYSIYEIKVAAFTQKGMGPYSDYVYGGKFDAGVKYQEKRKMIAASL